VPFAHCGLIQVVPVDAGYRYAFSVYVTNGRTMPLAKSAYGMIGIEWRDGNNKEISRVASTKWDATLSRARWETYRVAAKAPGNAVTAAFVIYLYDGGTGGAGCCYVDDAKVEAR
jgi:hypothetical protein